MSTFDDASRGLDVMDDSRDWQAEYGREAWADCPCEKHANAAANAAAYAYAAAAYATANAAAAAARIEILTGLIDEYDRITGRTTTPDVTQDDLRRCAEITRA